MSADIRCPYCGAVLVAKPSRKSACKHCGGGMFPKRLAGQAERALMTAEQEAENELAWRRISLQKVLDTDAATVGFPAGLSLAELIDLLKLLGAGKAVNGPGWSWPAAYPASDRMKDSAFYLSAARLAESERGRLHLQKMAASFLSGKYAEHVDSPKHWRDIADRLNRQLNQRPPGWVSKV